ncbi:MAG: ATP-binding protein, partial [Euryarchaeota archaeon]|nr:ATP-binding protein [Euryarchaeota archaeon]
MKEIVGWVLDNSAHDSFSFVVLEEKHVEFGNYYIVKHPTKGVEVLTRAVGINYKNPEMDITRYGPRYAKKGLKLPSSDQEILVASAEPLGYFEGNKFRPLEVPPSTWTPVYEAEEKDLEKFITPTKDGYYLKIGNLRNLKIPISIDVNGLVKGHCFICGQTRSGKSTFLLSLAAAAKKELDPALHLVIFDRRGEY